MKNFYTIKLAVMLVGVLSIVSCSEVEPIDPAVIQTPTPNPNPNPTNPGDPGTSTGDYWPAELNNQWVFSRNGVTQPPMKMISINSIGGQTYYTFQPQSGTSFGGVTAPSVTTRLRKTGADYYMRVEDFTTQATSTVPGSTTTGSETLLLRDNLPVGATWTTTYTQTTTYTDPIYPVVAMDFVVVGTIMEKGVDVTVGGETYTDVIKTKYVQNVTLMGQTTVTTSYYWFAKDIGPIRMLTESDPLDYDSLLLSYILN